MNKLILVLLSIIFISQATENLNPYIGVWMQESSYGDDGYPSSEYSYIAASYVKFIEMAGARVVPIQYDGDKAYYDSMLDQLDGFLFPGGSSEIGPETQLGQNAMYVFNKVKEINDSGKHFPMWGTCMGFQLLVTLASDFGEVLTHISDDQAVNHPITVENEGRILSSMPNQLLENAQTEAIQYFNHEWCVSIDTFNKNQKVHSFFNNLAYAQNDKGDKFVALIEAKNYPIWGVQWHPEKANFEWKVPANHSLQAVMNTQYYADYFVQQCRQNMNQFATEAEANKQVIYNYNPIQLESSSFEQLYMFKNFNVTHEQQQEKQQQFQKQRKGFLEQIFDILE